MEESMFFAYLETQVLQFCTAHIKTFILNAIQYYCMAVFKGFWDDRMATYSNELFMIPCGNCKITNCWDPFPIKALSDKKNKKESSVNL
jgi:hypothetical protein